MALDKPTSASKLGRYELLKEQPGMGVGSTWIARAMDDTSDSPKLSTVVRVHRHLTKKAESTEAFLYETKPATGFWHKNVVVLADVATDDGELYAVSEHHDAESLSNLTAAVGTAGLPQPVVLRIVLDVLAALSAAHAEDPALVHGELNPQHVLVGADGVTRVAGFATARALSRIAVPLGAKNQERLAHAAPERAKAMSSPTAVAPPLDARSDVFSAGVLLWEGLTKQRLFASKIEAAIVQKVLTAPISAPSSVPGVSVPAALDAAVQKALERDPAQRTQRASELAAVLETLGDAAIATHERVAAEVARLAGKAIATRRSEALAESAKRKHKRITIPPPNPTATPVRKTTLLGIPAVRIPSAQSTPIPGPAPATSMPIQVPSPPGSVPMPVPLSATSTPLPKPKPVDDGAARGRAPTAPIDDVFPKPATMELHPPSVLSEPRPASGAGAVNVEMGRPPADSFDLGELGSLDDMVIPPATQSLPPPPQSLPPPPPPQTGRRATTLLLGTAPKIAASEAPPPSGEGDRQSASYTAKSFGDAIKPSTPQPKIVIAPPPASTPTLTAPHGVRVAEPPRRDPPPPPRRIDGPASAQALLEAAAPTNRTPSSNEQSPRSRGAAEAVEKIGPGSTLGRYEILMPVARGGMASVWAAKLPGSRGFQKTFAIKTMLPDVSDDPDFESMFLDEGRVAARIRHPNVVEIIDLGEEDDVLYLVMEWVDGENLGALVKAARAHGGVPMPIIFRIASQVCAGLHAAHELRDDDGNLLDLVHRDISPANVLVSTNGFVKIVDFGIAKSKGRLHVTRVGGVVKGKTPYLSPEQLGQQTIDRRSDIFSFGVLLYVLATGLHPFRGDTDSKTIENIALREPVPLRAIVNTIPPEFEALVLKALSKDPKDRFATAAEMQRAVEQASATLRFTTTEQDVAAFVRRVLGDVLAKRAGELRAAIERADRTGDPEPVAQEPFSRTPRPSHEPPPRPGPPRPPVNDGPASGPKPRAGYAGAIADPPTAPDPFHLPPPRPLPSNESFSFEDVGVFKPKPGEAPTIPDIPAHDAVAAAPPLAPPPPPIGPLAPPPAENPVAMTAQATPTPGLAGPSPGPHPGLRPDEPGYAPGPIVPLFAVPTPAHGDEGTSRPVTTSDEATAQPHPQAAISRRRRPVALIVVAAVLGICVIIGAAALLTGAGKKVSAPTPTPTPIPVPTEPSAAKTPPPPPAPVPPPTPSAAPQEPPPAPTASAEPTATEAPSAAPSAPVPEPSAAETAQPAPPASPPGRFRQKQPPAFYKPGTKIKKQQPYNPNTL